MNEQLYRVVYRTTDCKDIEHTDYTAEKVAETLVQATIYGYMECVRVYKQ
jgi:hypothetical protein